ncbi:MAG: hypothetical protein EBQ75_07455 [Actinobacteria bacterium]|nr:hypothetical protein [Actinomycetota bacterium]
MFDLLGDRFLANIRTGPQTGALDHLASHLFGDRKTSRRTTTLLRIGDITRVGARNRRESIVILQVGGESFEEIGNLVV